MPLNQPVSNYSINSGSIPLLYPVRVLVPANATTRISFPDQFLGRAISLKISNNSGANAASYDYNLNFATLDNTVVNYLTITTGAAAADTVLVEAQILPALTTEVPIEVMV